MAAACRTMPFPRYRRLFTQQGAVGRRPGRAGVGWVLWARDEGR
jgi:hypothetical protein